MKLQWHNMICPICKSDHTLEVAVQGTAKLTESGSEDNGDHEWDENSHTHCECCGFAGPARMFDWSTSQTEKDGWVDLVETDVIDFEIQAFQMALDPSGGGYVLADSINAPQEDIRLIDIVVTRRHERLGIIDEIESIDSLRPSQSTGDVVTDLEIKYGLEALWV